MKKILILLGLCCLAACQTASPNTHIEVYRHDGSRQCSGGGIAPEVMQTELNGLQVYAARKDIQRGVVFPAVCGGGTAHINVYTIAAADLPQAQQRGFQPLSYREWD